MLNKINLGIFVVLLFLQVALSVKQSGKPAKKKSIVDLSDADIERIYDEWEVFE